MDDHIFYNRTDITQSGICKAIYVYNFYTCHISVQIQINWNYRREWMVWFKFIIKNNNQTRMEILYRNFRKTENKDISRLKLKYT